MSVRVAVRVRPFNSREKKMQCQCVVDMKDPQTILKAHQGQQERVFTFDFSFWSFDEFKEEADGTMLPTGSKYADQKQVYERIGTSILDNAWLGYHCCLFAYGQTGSGKSYSMIGYGPNKGIIPITCNEIFNRIAKKQANQQFQVYASMLEIYNEEVQDLTIPISKRPSQGLKIRENQLLGVYVDGVKKHFVSSFVQIQNVMEEGTKNRTVAATQMNATSSRAHTIITIEFKQITKTKEGKTEKISMINLVDLAGSERQDKTGATGQRLKQAVGINQSLTALGQVISVLAENSEGTEKFVPYRNSALTRILQNALGGNSQTIMICAISPANDNYDESLSTLRYADRAKRIKNKPVVNESGQDKLIRQLRQENDRLRKLLAQKGKDPNMLLTEKKEQPKKEQLKIEQPKKEQPKKEEIKKEEPKKEEIKKSQGQHKQGQLGSQKKLQGQKKTEQQNKIQQQKKLQQEKLQQQKSQKQDLDDNDDEQLAMIKANLIELQKRMDQQLKTRDQKEKQGQQDQLKMFFSDDSLNSGKVVKGKQLQKMEKEGKSYPYFENISKDFTLHRKLKILLEKEEYKIGKNNVVPPNDIIFGGRDMLPRHAVLKRVDTKVFLQPLSVESHLYVNGQKVSKTIELMHLDRVIFGWNSVYLFKNKDDKRSDETIKDRQITWDFCKDEIQHLVDIDQSDDEDRDGAACCQIF